MINRIVTLKPTEDRELLIGDDTYTVRRSSMPRLYVRAEGGERYADFFVSVPDRYILLPRDADVSLGATELAAAVRAIRRRRGGRGRTRWADQC